MDKKLTDSEIVKAFEKITKYQGFTVSVSNTLKATLDLINRLQAENERLIGEIMIYKVRWAKATVRLDNAKAEAYKECIEKVKEEIAEALKSNYKARAEREQSIPIFTENEFWNYCTGKIDCLRGLDDFLNNLLKELVGDK